MSQNQHGNEGQSGRPPGFTSLPGNYQALLSGIAHELRTPLASIRVQLEVALKSRSHPDWGQLGQGVLADTRRLSKLVEDILTLARLETQHTRADQRYAVDLAGLVIDSVNAYAESRVPIMMQVSGTYMVLGFPRDLARMARELIDNAVEWAATRVDLTLSQREGWVLLVVYDDGPGIPAGELKRVFEPFYRLDDARSRTGDGQHGAGLGLSIVQSVARVHHGFAWLEPGSPGTKANVRIAVQAT